MKDLKTESEFAHVVEGYAIVYFRTSAKDEDVEIDGFFSYLAENSSGLIFCQADVDVLPVVAKYSVFAVWKDGCMIEEYQGSESDKVLALVNRHRKVDSMVATGPAKSNTVPPPDYSVSQPIFGTSFLDMSTNGNGSLLHESPDQPSSFEESNGNAVLAPGSTGHMHTKSSPFQQRKIRINGSSFKGITPPSVKLFTPPRNPNPMIHSDAEASDELSDEEDPQRKAFRVPSRLKPTKFFKRRQLFVEMDELREKLYRDHQTHRFERAKHWVETHRWNFGLQEDLDEGGGNVWNHPHMPWCSAEGLVELQSQLDFRNILLDVGGNSLPDVSRRICNSLVHDGLLEAELSSKVQEALLVHASRGGRTRTVTAGSIDSESELGSPNRNKKDDFALGKPANAAKDTEEFELLCPSELEEAADVLVGDFPWMEEDLIVFVRLKKTLDLRLERHARARFLVLILGPSGDVAHARHVQLGEAFGALLQDEVVVEACYSAETPEGFIDAISVRVNKMTIIPHIHRPTDGGVKKRLKKLRQELAAASGIEHKRWVGGEWDTMAENAFTTGYTVANVVRFMEKYALPLLAGIVAAVILKNVDPEWYSNLEASHGSHHDYHYADSNITSADLHHDNDYDAPPLFFDLTIAGHDVNFHFIVNDVLMVFHFAIATEEVVESFLPGAILYPPTKAVVNPLMATLGGVLGPTIFFFIFAAIFHGAGAFDDSDYEFRDIVNGWAIPAATDIPLAWLASLLTFGKGHPAINYLLLLAVVDDAIGMVIIAVFYPDPDNPFLPGWLMLVVLAMALALIMNKLHVNDWRPYFIFCGPLAWYGMLKSHIHPALSMAFIVPFIPSSVSKLNNPSSITDGEIALLAENGEEPSDQDSSRSNVPLFKMAHAVAGLTDFAIMPLFGLVNAGVDVTTVGPFTAVIFLAATVGKTIGVGATAIGMERLGFPAPKGMGTKTFFLVGFIASIDLTVALFVADAAFVSDGISGRVQNEAKLGVLFVMINILIAIAIGHFYPFNFTPDSESKESDSSDNDSSSSEEDDEFLEHFVAINYVDRLRQIHGQVEQVEKETQITRNLLQKSIRERLHELEQESHREEENVAQVTRQRTISVDGRTRSGGDPAILAARQRSIAKLRRSNLGKGGLAAGESPIGLLNASSTV